MSKVNVYWKEECKYCVNRESCEYKEATEEYKNKLVETINKLDELQSLIVIILYVIIKSILMKIFLNVEIIVVNEVKMNKIKTIIENILFIILLPILLVLSFIYIFEDIEDEFYR